MWNGNTKDKQNCDPSDLDLFGYFFGVQSVNDCHINKQEMSQPSAISGLQMWMRAPQAAIQWMLVIAEELGECKKQGEQGNKTGPR